MRKHWVTLLSMLGLASSTMPARTQVLKGSEPNVTNDSQKRAAKAKTEGNAAGEQSKIKFWKGNDAASKSNASAKNLAESNATQAAAAEKDRKAGGTQLELNQQTLRQQNQGGKGNGALTPPPPGQAGGKNAVTKGNTAQVTKGNAAVTKGNAAVTKGNAAVTKGSNAVTKGNNAQITKGNSLAVTKGSAAVTKGSNAQITKSGNSAVTKTNNSAVTKAQDSALTKAKQ